MYKNCSITESLDEFGEKLCLNGHCVWMNSSGTMTAAKQCFCNDNWHGKRCTYYDPFPPSLANTSIIAISIACILVLLIISVIIVFKVLKVYDSFKRPKTNNFNSLNNYQKCYQKDNNVLEKQEI
uniref:Epidermal growth factor Smed-egf-4 n=1 Tax=Schmidtea mediterranea TaxID=79327 RepID=A0A1B1ACX8_SCHMD|nr:epidermal growth factor Smed-egf-4 [Schmidtea mediterranea]